MWPKIWMKNLPSSREPARRAAVEGDRKRSRVVGQDRQPGNDRGGAKHGFAPHGDRSLPAETTCLRQAPGQGPRLPRLAQAGGRVDLDAPGAQEVADEGPDGGERALDRGAREAALVEGQEEAPQDLGGELARVVDTALLEIGEELVQVAPVGAQRVGRRTARDAQLVQEAVDLGPHQRRQ